MLDNKKSNCINNPNNSVTITTNNMNETVEKLNCENSTIKINKLSLFMSNHLINQNLTMKDNKIKQMIRRNNTLHSTTDDNFKEKVIKILIQTAEQKITKFTKKVENIAPTNKNDLTEFRKLSIIKPEETDVAVNIKNWDVSVSSNKKICKICYEGDKDSNSNENNKLITPCKCQGTVKYIHEICLKNWILNHPKLSIRNSSCELCGFKYNLTFQTKLEFNQLKRCRYLGKFGTILAASFIILASITYIIFLIISNTTKMKDETKVLFGLILLGIFIIVYSIIAYFSIRNYRKHVFDEVLVDWGIKNFE